MGNIGTSRRHADIMARGPAGELLKLREELPAEPHSGSLYDPNGLFHAVWSSRSRPSPAGKLESLAFANKGHCPLLGVHQLALTVLVERRGSRTRRGSRMTTEDVN